MKPARFKVGVGFFMLPQGCLCNQVTSLDYAGREGIVLPSHRFPPLTFHTA